MRTVYRVVTVHTRRSVPLCGLSKGDPRRAAARFPMLRVSRVTPRPRCSGTRGTSGSTARETALSHGANTAVGTSPEGLVVLHQHTKRIFSGHHCDILRLSTTSSIPGTSRSDRRI